MLDTCEGMFRVSGPSLPCAPAGASGHCSLPRPLHVAQTRTEALPLLLPQPQQELPSHEIIGLSGISGHVFGLTVLAIGDGGGSQSPSPPSLPLPVVEN